MRTIFSFFIAMSLMIGGVAPAFAQQSLQRVAWEGVNKQEVKAIAKPNEPTLSGTVSKVDRNKNTVDLQTPLGPFRIKVSSIRAQNLNEGDILTVQLAQLERKNPLAELL
ncbi:MAG: hypothetical protein ACRERD_24530 [Candidatus Binatia bacterium]